ncbi:MAG: hypothetical protein RLZZ227_1790 [Pseudomonadota bacterium]
MFERLFTVSALFQRLAAGLVLSGILLFARSVSVAADVELPNRLDQHFEGVLGTSLDLTIYANDTQQMKQAAAAAVAEIARLEQILSTWLDDSELTLLNRTHATQAASDDLLAVVRHCEEWFARSSGMFSCRLKPVLDLWDAAVREQKIPNALDMQPVARAAHTATLTIDAERRHIDLGSAVSLEPSGLATGYIVDRAMAVLREAVPDATAIKLDIGGDASYWGSPPGQEGWLVGVADPQLTADNSGFVSSLALTSMAVTTSGHTSRTRTIRSRAFSHILVPERGWPVTNGVYAVVIAADTLTADVVATALAAQGAEAGLAWVNTLENVEALLISADGSRRTSRNWNRYLSEDLMRQAGANVSMVVDYTIPDLNERGYERPYVAIWISDAQGKAIRNLLLLGGEQRWASTNSRWWNSTRKRMDNVTRPTRNPGEYQLVWDGKDEFGAVLPAGDYQLHVEASRENGGHSYKRVPFTLAEGTQTFTQKGEDEIGDFSMTIEMRLPQ